MYNFNKYVRKYIYISCWYVNEFELVVMWDFYSKNDVFVVIEIIYVEIKNLLLLEVMIGLVKYIDYDKDVFLFDNIFYFFIYKRKLFEYEREVRFLI